MKTDFLPRRFRHGGRIQQSHDLFKHMDNSSFVDIQPLCQHLLDFPKFPGQIALIGQHLSHPDECANYKNAHLDRAAALQDICRHDGAVFCEGIRSRAVTAPGT